MTFSVFDRIVRRFTSDDVTRPQFRDPWQSATGEVLATDGKIAIVHRQPPPNNYPKEDPGYWRSRLTADLEGWIKQDTDDSRQRLRMPMHLDFALLKRAATAAMDDARANAPELELPVEDCDFCIDEPMTVDSFVRTNSVVILPGKRRAVVAAVYANLVADVAAAFGGCVGWGWESIPKSRRRDFERYWRVLFVGAHYDMLLMPVRTDPLPRPYNCNARCFRSVADAATGKLVHSYGDESPADFDVLRFGEKGGVA